MKQTPVEWLIEKRATGDLYFSDFLKAKEMEKQQQERMYSEEEVLDILREHTAEIFKGSKLTLTEWFEQFKNK